MEVKDFRGMFLPLAPPTKDDLKCKKKEKFQGLDQNYFVFVAKKKKEKRLHVNPEQAGLTCQSVSPVT